MPIGVECEVREKAGGVAVLQKLAPPKFGLATKFGSCIKVAGFLISAQQYGQP